MRKYNLFIFLVMVLLFCSAFSKDNVDYKFSKEYQSSEGVVIFDHKIHSSERQKDCHACHSALDVFGGSMNELFAHNYCKNCHETHNGPTECNECHDRKKIAIK